MLGITLSLAAALGLPPGFPERDLLVYLTLCVIFPTLVAQGLTPLWLVSQLGVRVDGVTEREELDARTVAMAGPARRRSG